MQTMYVQNHGKILVDSLSLFLTTTVCVGNNSKRLNLEWTIAVTVIVNTVTQIFVLFQGRLLQQNKNLYYYK